MTQQPSNQTVREWQETAPYWTKYSAIIKQMFTPLTNALIESAGIRPGQSVLDIAGGSGEPSISIAEMLRGKGSVMCTDAVGEMVAAARAEAAAADVSNIDFRQCNADELPFPDNSFDVAVCRLGAMFFPDPPGAVEEMLRVVRPGGVLALAVWGRSRANPYSYLVTEVIARYSPTPPADEDAPGAFRFATPGKLARILGEAGAAEIQERVVDFDLAAPLSPEEFWTFRSSISETVRSKLEQLPNETRARIATDVLEAVKEYFPHNEMRFPAEMLIVTGKKPM